MTSDFYIVGGAVRDRLLGLPASDRDWVAVGTTPQALAALGYKPVGKDFPVFLHPETGEDVALARTERKTGAGYHGFAFHAAPEVTLEQDLARRDLTINAIAQAADGRLIDPHGGQRDIAVRVLRHVSPAFVEDPVRLLRLARLAARFSDFSVAPETQALLSQMVDQGEVDALVPERVWQEIARGLMTSKPSRMLQVLRDCGALKRLLPEVEALWMASEVQGPHRPQLPQLLHVPHLPQVLDRAAALDAPLPVRWACLVRDPQQGQAMAERLRVPNDCREVADVVARELNNIHRSVTLDAESLLGLFERCDALRRPQRFGQALQACQCDAQGADEVATRLYGPTLRLPPLLQAAMDLDTSLPVAAALAAGLKGPAIGEAVRQARATAIQRHMGAPDTTGPGA